MKVLSYINILSLDVVMGAMCCALYLGQFWGTTPSWPSVLLLGCVVWLIYTFDRLKDVYKAVRIPQTRRHAFHARHFDWLMVLAMVVMLTGLFLLVTVNEVILRSGTALLILVCIYFVLLHFLPGKARFHKEFVIALLYTAGVFLPPAATLTGIKPELVLQFFQLMAIALGNLLCFSLYEYSTDRAAGFPSLMEMLPAKTRRPALLALLVSHLLICIVLYLFLENNQIELVFGLMTGVLLVLVLFSRRIHNTDLYRLLGDVVFVIPVFFMKF